MLIAIWRALETTPLKPTINMVCRIVRNEGGYKFSQGEAKTVLAKFSSVRRTAGVPQNEHERTDDVPNPYRLRARAKGITSYKESATQTSLLANGTAGKQKKLPLPGHRILDALVPLVAPHLEKMTVRTWRQRNAAAAQAMAEGGITPGEAAEAWQAEYERTGRPQIVLRFLHDRMAAGAATNGAPVDPYANFPLAEDL